MWYLSQQHNLIFTSCHHTQVYSSRSEESPGDYQRNQIPGRLQIFLKLNDPVESLSINKILELVDINWCRLSNSNALAVSKSIISVSTAKSVISCVCKVFCRTCSSNFLVESEWKRLLEPNRCWNHYKSWLFIVW